MGIEIIIIALVAALIGGYVVTKSGGVANTTPSGNTINPSTQIVLPHLLAGAKLLSDQQIAQMEADAIGTHFTYLNDKPIFITKCISNLSKEQVIDLATGQGAKNASAPITTICGAASQYQGPPLALSALKDGSVALGVVGTAAAGGFGASAAGTLAAAGISSGVLAGVTFGLGAVISIYSIISAHHKAAIAREHALECGLIPPANQSLLVIEQAVVNGVITIQQGQAALDQLHTDFVQAASGGLGGLEDAPSKLNAMGWYAHELNAIITKKKNRYANLVS